MPDKHNHVTRDIKPPGRCPGCDEYHRSRGEGHRAEPCDLDPDMVKLYRETLAYAEAHGGLEALDELTGFTATERESFREQRRRQMPAEDSRNRGESADVERTRLARQLEAGGHAGCAYDLESADEIDVAQVAYSIAEHVEEACGDAYFHADPELAAEIRAWADKLEQVDPEVARKGRIPVTVHRVGEQVFVDVTVGDLLDLSREGDGRVVLTVNGEPLVEYIREE